ncbi:MAG: hypothetical protein U0M58_09375 [Blautia sp.]|nr:hypothetical protein [Blautia sp.]
MGSNVHRLGICKRTLVLHGSVGSNADRLGTCR